MQISQLNITNFRLLESVELILEKGSTLIVGRNNSGKTSLTELFRRFLGESSPRFGLEDFSLGVHEQFWSAYQLFKKEEVEEKIRAELPEINAVLIIKYDDNSKDFSSLNNFIIDLNEDCNTVKVNIIYSLEQGKIKSFFNEIGEDRLVFFKNLRENIPKYFKTTIEAIDPNDDTNRKSIEYINIRSLLQVGFINAERALDDKTHSGKDILGKVLEALFRIATLSEANTSDKATAESLKSAVTNIQEGIDSDFNNQLIKLIPAFNLFGYPGLSDPELLTETELKVEQLLSNHTTVRYKGVNGINLPESYNGLGLRNLIYLLLKLLEFFRSFVTNQPEAGVHLIFIEEPEAHLHPQMQNVFIKKLGEIAQLFSREFNDNKPWPVQFVITTHSSHIANEAKFESMRYFLAKPHEKNNAIYSTIVKDLKTGLSEESKEVREFLHKYMTLTRCDLLFADRAIIIEGTSERLLLPTIIEKIDNELAENELKLGSLYLTIMEVGGAYAHKFFNLIDFLNLKTLIITDIDTIDKKDNRKKCRVSVGTHTSNACINNWFTDNGDSNPTKDELLVKTDEDKIKKNRRLAYQIPHTKNAACGRSFEDAFILANLKLFSLTDLNLTECEKQAENLAERIEKSDFALEYAIDKTDWVIPQYIKEGLVWLKQPPENKTTLTKKLVKAKNKKSDEKADA